VTASEPLSRDSLVAHLDQLLQPLRFRDYAPNGLQVEGRAQVRRVITGVTASQALLDAAVAHGADAVLVHHGYFWRNEPPVLTGWRRRRIATLLAHDISLLAYHLPLDAHPDVGNNAGLGRVLGLSAEASFGDQSIGCLASLPAPTPVGQLAATVAAALGRTPQLLGDLDRSVQRVAWCTGGAQSMFADAIAAGADLYITGEASEPCTHLARESGVVFMAAGHHATERFGVQSLAAHLASTFNIDACFVDVDNPI